MDNVRWLILILGLVFLAALVWFGVRFWRGDVGILDPKKITMEYQARTRDPLLTDTQGVLDLSLGDPTMYLPFWQREAKALPQKFPYPSYQLGPNFSNEIKSLLKYLYDYVPPSETIVVGNGSMQLIAAYFSAIKQLVSEPEHRMLKLAINRPTLPVLPDLVASIGGIEIVDLDYDGQIDLEYIITPNYIGDPVVSQRRARYRLLDHAYAWPQYTSILSIDDRPVGDQESGSDQSLAERPDLLQSKADHLFSLSKGVGFAGFRCGVGVIQDPDVRSLVESYIFNTTLGINTAGWELGLEVIDPNQRLILDRTMAYGKAVLDQRWRQLLALGDPTLANNHGAYAWFRRSPDQFMEYRVRVTRGSTLLVDDQWSRVSMIGSQHTFELFLVRLRRLLGTTSPREG